MTGTRPYRIVAAGDSVLVAEFEDRIDETVNSRVVALAEALGQKSVAGLRDIVPTFRSVAIYFDPLRTDVGALARLLEEEDLSTGMVRRESATVRIPVCYGGPYGQDLQAVAASTGLSEAEVADIHAGSTYRVYMLGFLPGFAYMGLVDERIAVPRRAVPRVRVPAGSVGIAGRQTGIYPSDSPGGWQLIGKTPLRPFDVNRGNPFLLSAGDLVRFYPIDVSELERAAAQ